MTHKRIFLQDLTDQHLQMIHDVLNYSPWDTFEEYCQQILDGTMHLYEFGKGLVGVRIGEKQLEWVFASGEGLIARKEEILECVRALKPGFPIEGFVVHPGMVRLASKLGFKPVGAYMRFA